jgi:hypothetical protein
MYQTTRHHISQFIRFTASHYVMGEHEIDFQCYYEADVGSFWFRHIYKQGTQTFFTFKFTAVHFYGRNVVSTGLLHHSDEMCLSCPTSTSRQSECFLDFLYKTEETVENLTSFTL